MKPLTNVQTGTMGGTLCSLWTNFDMGDLLSTVVMAAIGAVVSYSVSRLLAGKKPRQ